MMELTQHLEVLLLENDCVILPDFGGFITHDSPSKWIEAEKLFLPPTRTIGFNPDLKINDGLLVHSYMEVYEIDFKKASQLVENAIGELKSIIQQHGKVELSGIGILSMSIDQIYEFSPNEDGITSSSLYGLYSFDIDKLKNKDNQSPALEEPILIPFHPEEKSSKTNLHFIRHIAAAAIAVIAFFLMSTPIENTYIDNETNYASLFSWNLLEHKEIKENPVSLSDVNSAKEETKKQVEYNISSEESILEETSSSKVKVEEKKNITSTDHSKPEATTASIATKTPEKETVKPQNTATKAPVTNRPTYEIIVASIAHIKDAPQLVENYKKLGYPDASVIEKNGRIRISIMSFSNAQEAYKALPQLQEQKQFKDAWVLQVK